MMHDKIIPLNWLGSFVFLLMTLGKLAGEEGEDYRFKLVEWLDEVEEGHIISKLAEYRNVPLLRGQTASLGPGSRMELSGSHGEVVRLGQNTVFTLLHDRQVQLSRGALLLYLPPSDMPFRVRGLSTDFYLSQGGTVVLEVVSNRNEGGFSFRKLETADWGTACFSPAGPPVFSSPGSPAHWS